ncbi:MAG: hypothetical protein FJX80_00540 [Bacteroidetes bacterium]|nr:hypothetical protein [Bacteroidota bacterium]
MGSNMLKQASIKTEINRSWWYRLLRSISMFCYNFWWVIWLIFIFFLIFWVMFCFYSKAYTCNADKKIEAQLAAISKNIDSCCACNGRSISDINRIRDSLGGRTGPITITLKWESLDDLDLSLKEPSGDVINYQRKYSPHGGHLDIDMNAGVMSYDPIENIYYENIPPVGNYRVAVTFFSRKSRIERVPFRVYVKYHDEQKIIDGVVSRPGERINIFEFTF